MIDDPDGKELMQACGVDLEQLGETLTLFIDEEMSELVNPNGEAPRATQKVSKCLSASCYPRSKQWARRNHGNECFGCRVQ